jgi:hypothetical protein
MRVHSSSNIIKTKFLVDKGELDQSSVLQLDEAAADDGDILTEPGDEENVEMPRCSREDLDFDLEEDCLNGNLGSYDMMR